MGLSRDFVVGLSKSVYIMKNQIRFKLHSMHNKSNKKNGSRVVLSYLRWATIAVWKYLWGKNYNFRLLAKFLMETESLCWEKLHNKRSFYAENLKNVFWKTLHFLFLFPFNYSLWISLLKNILFIFNSLTKSSSKWITLTLNRIKYFRDGSEN